MSRRHASRKSDPDQGLWRPSLAAGIRFQLVDNEAILLDRGNQRVHQLNRAGASILRYCDGNRTVPDIVSRLLQDFEVGPEQLSADVTDLLQRMRALDLLT